MLWIFSHWFDHFDWYPKLERIRESFEKASFCCCSASAGKRWVTQRSHTSAGMHSRSRTPEFYFLWYLIFQYGVCLLQFTRSTSSFFPFWPTKPHILFNHSLVPIDGHCLSNPSTKYTTEIYSGNWNWKIRITNIRMNDENGINKIDSKASDFTYWRQTFLHKFIKTWAWKSEDKFENQPNLLFDSRFLVVVFIKSENM